MAAQAVVVQLELLRPPPPSHVSPWSSAHAESPLIDTLLTPASTGMPLLTQVDIRLSGAPFLMHAGAVVVTAQEKA